MTGERLSTAAGWFGDLDDPAPDIDPAVLALVEPELPAMMAAYQERLRLDPDIAEILGRLTPEQLARARAQQVAHLGTVLSPHASRALLLERSRALGRVHAMAGVEVDWYVDAVAETRRAVLALVGRACSPEQHTAVQVALGERFMTALHGALLGYRDFDRAQSSVQLAVSQAAADARTVADLARGVVEALGCLEGIALCLFARPDAEGSIEYEFGAGVGFEEYVAAARSDGAPQAAVSNAREQGLGPVGRAWRSGEVTRCDSYATDPTTAPWRHLTQRFGLMSGAVVPLADRNGQPRALLSLYARWPGYFATEAFSAMLAQVKQTVEQVYAELLDQPALSIGVSTHVDRAQHLARLRDGAVKMLFQPVVRLPGGELSKVEALARLRDGGRLVTPAEFLPAFGDDELFDLFEIGLAQSLDALRRWDADGVSTGMSVNLPVSSVDDDRYVRTTAELLTSYGVAPARLTLELLETGFVDREMHRRSRSFERLKELGVRLAQDDLGSGYSSLLRLRAFAFDEVKIDQTLVRGTELAPGAALHFIGPIADIAHSLGVHVVIEGLEDEGLVEAAVQFGVDAGQGYGIARPMPRDALVDWVRGYRLEVDQRRPRTVIGALAGHVAWEHRSSAGRSGRRESRLDLDGCPLTAYMDGIEGADGTGRDLVAAHREVHAIALTGRGSAEHREAWTRLAGLLGA